MVKQKQSRGAQLVGAVTFVVVFIVLMTMCTGDKEEPASERDTSEPRQTESSEETLGGSIGETVEAWVAAQNFVRKELVSPSTAKFNGVAMAPYVVYLGDARYRVSASVDSQNSFGAMLRTEFEAVVRAERDEHMTWILESLDF